MNDGNKLLRTRLNARSIQDPLSIAEGVIKSMRICRIPLTGIARIC